MMGTQEAMYLFVVLLSSSVLVQSNPNIYVINLAHRTERLRAFEERILGVGLNYTRIDAVDQSSAKELLDSGKVAVNATFRDATGRHMTLGEVGCSLSHLRAWEQIARLPNNAYGAVFEDDANFENFPEGFKDRFEKVLRKAVNHEVDFVYMTYRDPYQKESNDDLLQPCISTWWTLGYMISSKAARKLVADGESLTANVIPSDEYLPIVLGTLDHSHNGGSCTRDPRYPNVRLSCMAVKERMASPFDLADERGLSDTEVSKHVDIPKDSEHLLVVTVATDSSHYGYMNLLRSTNYFNYQLMALGLGETWTGGDMRRYEGGNMKLALLKDYLREVDDEQLILFTDGYDTMLQLEPKILIRRYEDDPSDVLFAAEIPCWPDEDLCSKYSELLPATVKNGRFRYLNSGTFMGKAKHIKILLEDFDEKRDIDDQRFFSAKLLASLQNTLSLRMGLDYNCTVFQALSGMVPEDWHMSEEHSSFYFSNKKTGSVPVVLHGNGGHNRVLVSIGNYIARGYNSFYRTLHHVPVPDVELYPLALGLFFTGTPFEDEFVEHMLSLNLDWSQVHVFAYYAPTSRLRINDLVQGRFRSYTQKVGGSECLARATFLRIAKSFGATFALMLDSEVFIEHSNTVPDLAQWNETVVAGQAQRDGMLFSNFWNAMSSSGWWEESFNDKDVFERKTVGLWQVPYAYGLLLIRRDVLGKMAELFDRNGSGDCARRACVDALYEGVGIFADNRKLYASLLGDTVMAKPGALFPELFEAQVNPKLWAKRYLVPNYENVQLDEPCQDVYGGVFLTKLFCDQMVITTEAENKWSAGTHDDARVGGHENYPTQDIHMDQFGWNASWQHIVANFIRPLINKQYEGVTFKARINLAFVVRYSMEGQRLLEPHNDFSKVTTTVLLNSEFEGSGVHFTRYNCTHNSKTPGYLLFHPGQVTHNHQALELKDGRRYVLVSFND